MSHRNANPIAVRLPIDLDEAVRSRAAAEGLSMSEMIRAIVSQWAYGAGPSVEEGYYQARQLALRVAFTMLADVFRDRVPQTYEEAVAIVNDRAQMRNDD